MSRQFYEDYHPDGLFFVFADVVVAYEYLQGDHLHTLEELRRNFKAILSRILRRGGVCLW